MQDSQKNAASFTVETVSQYLRDNPLFFEQNAHLLAEIQLPSPHGNGTISLVERQQLAQRDKVRILEVKLANLIGFAEENDATSAKVHTLSVQLMQQNNLNELQTWVSATMRESFGVAHTQLNVWLKPPAELESLALFDALENKYSDWVCALNHPYVGEKPNAMPAHIAAHYGSFAVVPLLTYVGAENKPTQKTIGALTLCAETATHFKRDMGTLYLARIGDLIGAHIVQQLNK